MKGIVLLSGGIDSAVAAHLMLSKCTSIEALHCSFKPLVNEEIEEKCKKVCEILGIKILNVVPIGHEIPTIGEGERSRYYFVLQKRMFLEIAGLFKPDFIVTGDNLGQVSSQTTSNLVAISNNFKIPIHRPLLCWDKKEIIDYAKKKGLYEATTGPEICDIFGPKHPSTKSPTWKIKAQAEEIDLRGMAKRAFKAKWRT